MAYSSSPIKYSFNEDVSLTSKQVQEGLAKGENPIKLLRQHKGIEPEEMAAVLEVGLPVYLGMEAGAQISTDRLKGICWYMDVSPLEFIPPEVTQTDGYVVNALIDAHNNPDQWPHDSEDMRVEIGKKLEWLAAPGRTYHYLGIKYKAAKASNQKTHGMLVNILDTILANDGNPCFHPFGATGYVQDAIWRADHKILKRQAKVRLHKKRLIKAAENLNKTGLRIYKKDDGQWKYVKAMMAEYHLPEDPDSLLEYLMNEAPKPIRGLSGPPRKSDFEELIQAFAEYQGALSFERKRSKYEAKIKFLQNNRNEIASFKSDDAVGLKIYDNRQKILIYARGIGKPMGNPNHPNYARSGVPVKDSSVKFSPR